MKRKPDKQETLAALRRLREAGERYGRLHLERRALESMGVIPSGVDRIGRLAEIEREMQTIREAVRQWSEP